MSELFNLKLFLCSQLWKIKSWPSPSVSRRSPFIVSTLCNSQSIYLPSQCFFLRFILILRFVFYSTKKKKLFLPFTKSVTNMLLSCLGSQLHVRFYFLHCSFEGSITRRWWSHIYFLRQEFKSFCKSQVWSCNMFKSKHML